MEDVCDPHLIEYDFRRDGLADFTSQGCVILRVFAYGKRCPLQHFIIIFGIPKLIGLRPGFKITEFL
jgi:hypothetical protein